MGFHRRTAAEKEFDRAFISDKIAMQWSQEEIRAELEKLAQRPVHKSMVSRDITALRIEWRNQAIADTSVERGQYLMEIRAFERICWDRFLESQKPREISTTERVDLPPRIIVPKGQPGAAVESIARSQTKAQLKKENRDGSPRWMDLIRWCKEERAKVLGLYAPTKVEQTGKDGGPVEHDIVIHEEREFLTPAEQNREMRRLMVVFSPGGEADPYQQGEVLPPGFQSPN